MLKEQKQEQDEFYEALLGSLDALWWRKFIALVKERRSKFMETLATNSELGEKKENIVRGQISEDAFIIALDEMGHAEEKRRKEESTRRRDNGPERSEH